MRKMASGWGGRPPVYLHVFRVTGGLIREARASLFWENDQTATFAVDGVPEQVPTMLVATVEPGVVLRAVVPPASPERPAVMQRIDVNSEVLVQELARQGIIPSVAPAGIGSVVLQGGLDPGTAAELNRQAAAELQALANDEWAKGLVPEFENALRSLGALSAIQQGIAADLAAGKIDREAGNGQCAGNLLCWETFARRNVVALVTRIDESQVEGPPPESVRRALERVLSLLTRAVALDILPSSSIVSPDIGYNLFQISEGFVPKIPFPWRGDAAFVNLAQLVDAEEILDKLGARQLNPNGVPFTEAEILNALLEGKGPYRQSCAQIGFDGERMSCRVVANPLDKTMEVILSRKALDLQTTIEAVAKARQEKDEVTLRRLITQSPSILAFVEGLKRNWASPIGIWRLSLIQDETTIKGIVQHVDANGNTVVGSETYERINDLKVIHNAEVKLEAPGKTEQDVLSAGQVFGNLSIWLPNVGAGTDETQEHLDNLALSFYWNDYDQTLEYGVITGDRRQYGGADQRMVYDATFEATMIEKERIVGTWEADDGKNTGRLEMVRGGSDFKTGNFQ